MQPLMPNLVRSRRRCLPGHVINKGPKATEEMSCINQPDIFPSAPPRQAVTRLPARRHPGQLGGRRRETEMEKFWMSNLVSDLVRSWFLRYATVPTADL